MRLADFIVDNIEPILVEWEVFARSISAASEMTPLALRDHASDILLATVHDMQTSLTISQRADKSRGRADPADCVASAALNGASERHAVDRLTSGFDLLEVVSEYRALRASVLRLWASTDRSEDRRDVDDVTRFDESIDQSLTKAVTSYTQRVDQARDMFLAILSHDLRNPLNSIAMSAHLLPGLREDEAGVSQATHQITSSVTVMGRMIGDLLDYTRTRLGAGMPVTPTPIDLTTLGRELINEYQSAHPARALQLHTEGNLRGDWDADRIRQAVSNLLGNAVQHGDDDAPVTLSITADDDVVSIAVRNVGDPILPGEMAKIFDPLVRGSSAHNPRKNRPGSIGMGLYIAREVARSHGGGIDVQSSAAETIFTLRLPRHAAPRTGDPILDARHVQTM